MSLGITLLFRPSSDGHWCQMYIVDMQGHCPSCGCEQTKRYYLDTPYHTLSVTKLSQLFTDSNKHFSASCEQCGDFLGAADVVRKTCHFGFADGGGLIQYFENPKGVYWQLSPHASFDGQLIPVWEAEKNIASEVVEELSERSVYRVFRRTFSPKEAYRSFIKRGEELSATIAPGLEVTLLPQTVEQLDQQVVDGWLDIEFPCQDSWGEPLPGHPWEWLRDVGFSLPKTSIKVELGAVEQGIRYAVGSFPMEVEMHREGDLLTLTTSDDILTFPLKEIAKEAASTMSAPGDIGHLEVDRAIHALHWEEIA